MGISTGEVTSTLRFLVSTSDLDNAKQALADLRAEYGLLGNAATTAGSTMLAALQAATTAAAALQTQLAAVQTAMMGVAGAATAQAAAQAAATTQAATAATSQTAVANAALAATVATTNAVQGQIPALQATTQGYDNMEGSINRIILRLGVLYAIRGLALFVIDLFTSAAAMEELAAKTQLSIGELKTWEGQGAATGVTANAVASAIDNFQKGFNALHPPMVDAIRDIGLLTSTLQAQRPDNQINMVVDAIAKLPTHVERMAATVKIFGTDAVTPLVEILGNMSDAAKRNYSKTQEDQVKAMADTDKIFKETGENLKRYAANAIVGWQDLWAKGLAPFFSDDWKKLSTWVTFDPAPLTHDVELLKEFQTISKDTFVGPMPFGGSDFIDNLMKKADLLSGITEEQLKQVGQLKEMGELSLQNAVQLTKDGVNLNINSEIYKRILDVMKDSEASIKRSEQIELQRQEALKTGYEQQIKSLERINAESAKSYGDRAQIDNINQLIGLERILTEGVLRQTDSVVTRAKIQEESALRIIALEKQKVTLGESILKVINDQIAAELAARAANNAAFGQNPMGLPDADHINAADAAERKYEESLRQLQLYREKGIDTTQREIQLQRQFYQDLDAGTQRAVDELNKVAAAEERVAAAATVLQSRATTPGSSTFTPGSSGSPFTTGPGTGLAPVSIQADFNGILLSNDPAARAQLGTMVSDFLTDTLRANRKLGAA